jgi:superoxide dismutase, Cu-Zn family
MKLTHSSATLGLLVLLGASLTLGCNSDSAGGGTTDKVIGMSSGALVVFPNPYAADATKANPIPATASATAKAWDAGGKLRLQLTVTGMPASRPFGAHLHKQACDNGKAGTHYQNNAAPGDAGQNPVFANAMNEAWLDFTPDTAGSKTVETTVDWIPRAGEAKAIILHDMATAEGGKAGDKLACLPFTF